MEADARKRTRQKQRKRHYNPPLPHPWFKHRSVDQSVGLSVNLFIAVWEMLAFESWVRVFFWFPHVSSFRCICASLLVLEGPSIPWLVWPLVRLSLHLVVRYVWYLIQNFQYSDLKLFEKNGQWSPTRADQTTRNSQCSADCQTKWHWQTDLLIDWLPEGRRTLGNKSKRVVYKMRSWARLYFNLHYQLHLYFCTYTT